MPNHCQNKLIIKGDKKYIDRFIKRYMTEDMDLDFNKVIPQPRSKKELLKKYPKYYVENNHTYGGENESYSGIDRHFDGYNGCRDYGDTKWNAMDTNFTRPDNNTAIIGFDTAWNPPIKVVDKLQELEPKLDIELRYYESGMGLAGSVVDGIDFGYNGDLEVGSIEEGFEDRF